MQSENQLILICLEEFIWLWMHFERFRVLGLVTFSEEQTNLTVCWDELRAVGRKVRLASDSRDATNVLFFRVNFMELKLFGLLSFGVSFGSWFGREME